MYEGLYNMSETSPLADRTYAQILSLELDTVVNPEYEPDYQVTVAEALGLSYMLLKQQIPDELAIHFRTSPRVNADLLLPQIEMWNSGFATTGMVDAIQTIAASNWQRTVRRISSTVYSEVKETQVLAAAYVISSTCLSDA